jgi:hypothetical protein
MGEILKLVLSSVVLTLKNGLRKIRQNIWSTNNMLSELIKLHSIHSSLSVNLLMLSALVT